MNSLFYKFKILFLRVLCYEKPLRVAIVKYLSLKYKTFRPHYETLLYETAKNSIKLGYKDFQVLELGVAGGDGIKSLINYKKKIEKVLDVKIHISGFDTGRGLPDVLKKEDLPFFWKKGDYSNTDLLNLDSSKDNVKIFIGDIAETVDIFLSSNKSKIGLLIFDLDLYSSTKTFLSKLQKLSKSGLLFPRTFCYFDDLFVADYSLDNTNGEPLAISEFNKENEDLKLGKTFDHINDFKFSLAKGQVYTLHDYNNRDYNKYIGIYSSSSLTQDSKDKIRSVFDD